MVEELSAETKSNDLSSILRKGKIAFILGIFSLSVFSLTLILFLTLSTFHEFGLQTVIIFYVLIITSILGFFLGVKSEDSKQGKYGFALNIIALFIIFPTSVIFTWLVFFMGI